MQVEERYSTVMSCASSSKLSIEIECAKCDCCGLTEECTPTYIAKVRSRYQGRWICGLCGEAVKDEVFRSGRIITGEEALDRHISFCNKFRSSTPPTDSAQHLISAMRDIVRRSFDSPHRPVRSTPSSPVRNEAELRALVRSESCFPALAR